MSKCILMNSLSPALRGRIKAELKANRSLASVESDDKLIRKLLKAYDILGDYLDSRSRRYQSTMYFAVNQKVDNIDYDLFQPYTDKAGEELILVMFNDYLFDVFTAFKDNIIETWKDNLWLKDHEVPEITAQGRNGGWLCFKLADLRPSLYEYLVDTFEIDKLLISYDSSSVITQIEEEGYTKTDIKNLYNYSVALKTYLEGVISDVKKVIKDIPADFKGILEERYK